MRNFQLISVHCTSCRLLLLVYMGLESGQLMLLELELALVVAPCGGLVVLALGQKIAAAVRG